ncbi:MAG: hypothetical protein ACMZI0_17220 [Symbiopectobacterium sp.]|uniref:hypothetical protein n=1 Tax=Symbiopectobacterium sp. TaxID=2952789 RepID=UPI0039EAE769
MATIPTQTHPLLSVPFSTAMDFTELAAHCGRFAETLIESEEPALKLALCERLVACLSLLRTTLNEPVPPHLVESLTVDTLPATESYFEPGSDLLCDYCLALGQLLTERPLSLETERVLTGLLTELVWCFSAGIKAPRWVRTENGVKRIDVN